MMIMQESGYRNLRQRDEYTDSMERLLEELKVKAEKNRKEKFTKSADKKKLRSEYTAMLGWPLTSYAPDSNVNVKTEAPAEYNGMLTTRYQLELLPGFWFYGMLYEHKESTRATKNAFVIAQHGGLGIPEAISGIIGPSGNYNDMVPRVLAKDVTVFAPQLFLWSTDSVYGGKRYDRVGFDQKLKQYGGSITAFEIYCIMRCIDYFAGTDWIDEGRIGMVGLSYGGMYTLCTAAVDTRIKVALSSCSFNDRLKYNGQDWIHFDQANRFFDAEVGCLVLPRKLYIEIGDKDGVFEPDSAEEDMKRLREYAEHEDCADSLKINVFDGGHEIDKADCGINFFLENL